ASIVAVEAVDPQIGRLVRATPRAGGALIVTADHGNADEMFEHDPKTAAILRDSEGRAQGKTSHPPPPRPLSRYAPRAKPAVDPGARAPGLANLAATALALMGWQAPRDYAPSLLA